MAQKKAVDSYGAEAIRKLKGLEAVRERPGMYIGDPVSGDALHHCIKEVVDNSVDEHLAGHCTKIGVVLEPDGWCRVTDNGRGIPVGMHSEGVSALQLVLCDLHAGGKFDQDSYDKSAGLHGVGVSAVNAVSSRMEATVWRDGSEWSFSCERGTPVSDVVRVGASAQHGTMIAWQRDLQIFKGVVEYDRKQVALRLQELAFLNPGLEIVFTDSRGAKVVEERYHYKGGIKDYLVEVVGRKKTMLPVMFFSDTSTCSMAFCWTDNHEEDIRCYANNTYNRDGGTHLTGFKDGLTRIVTTYAKEHNLLHGVPEDGLIGADIREGIVAIVNLRVSNLSFSSQTKDKLVTPEAKTIVTALFADQVAWWFKENPGAARKVAERAVINARAREAARRAREGVQRKEWLDPSSLPGKLADCQSKNAEECEIFIVEGDSAGGSAKGGRDRKTQAILPLRGKVLNVENESAEKILENKEIGTLITALGCGIVQTKSFDLSKLRYHKVVLLTDADVDGAHIRTLLLTFFYRCMPQLIFRGHLYIALPPLYGVHVPYRKKVEFLLDKEQLESFQRTLTPEQLKGSRVTRYKGLGEMNADDLGMTTMNPAFRTMKQVTIEDAVAAEQYFNLFMGESVENRREWIENNATYANDLDV